MKYLVLLSVSTLLLANEDMLNLLEDFNNASKISTKTKLNINKTPAVVSVLHASELQKLGITTVYEALETVPGVEVSMGLAGGKQINMRGNKSIVTDKLKFMVDGIAINAELSGANLFYLNMPLENIARIEIIRGPASALYGSYAHIGLINVITKASTHKKGVIFLRASSEGSKNVGFTQHINNQNVKIALLGSYQKNDNSREYNNYSLLPNSGPFTSFENFATASLGANIELYNDISFTTKYLQHKTQNYFGYGVWPIVQDPKELVHTSFVNELEYKPQLTKELSLDLKIGYKEYSIAGESRLHPYSIQEPKPPYPPYDLIAKGDYREQVYYGDFSLNYYFFGQNITLGSYLSQTKANDATYATNNPAVSEDITNSISGGGLVDNIKRDQYAFYLSDIITLSSAWMINLGLRYDNYSDADSALSPKLSFLYMPDEMQSYKLMYQNSFRVPTLAETYGTEVPFFGDESLRSETIDTLEFAYSYQKYFNQWIHINFFYSQQQNFIYRDAFYTFKNGLDTESYGAEFEFKTPLYDILALQANYSYVYSKDETGNETPMIANHLANLMLSYQIDKDWHTGTHIRYVGDKKREEFDARSSLKAYTTFDQTLTYIYKDFLFQTSIKNIFDADVRYPSPKSNETSSGTYLDDQEQNGRTFWISAQWKFE